MYYSKLEINKYHHVQHLKKTIKKHLISKVMQKTRKQINTMGSKGQGHATEYTSFTGVPQNVFFNQ